MMSLPVTVLAMMSALTHFPPLQHITFRAIPSRLFICMVLYASSFHVFFFREKNIIFDTILSLFFFFIRAWFFGSSSCFEYIRYSAVSLSLCRQGLAHILERAHTPIQIRGKKRTSRLWSDYQIQILKIFPYKY